MGIYIGSIFWTSYDLLPWINNLLYRFAFLATWKLLIDKRAFSAVDVTDGNIGDVALGLPGTSTGKQTGLVASLTGTVKSVGQQYPKYPRRKMPPYLLTGASMLVTSGTFSKLRTMWNQRWQIPPLHLNLWKETCPWPTR